MFQRNYMPGLFGIKRVNWSALLNNTQKTLNIINQAIPIVYQVKPMIANAKTMFQVINAVKGDDVSTTNNDVIEVTEENKNSSDNNTNKNGPIFYI